MSSIIFTILIGVGATLVMDLWSLLRKSFFGLPPTNWGLVGRWIAHMKAGKVRHKTITDAKPIYGEQLIGWLAHYVIGIGYAVLLIAVCGQPWINKPTLVPALILGIVTVVAPFFILQPGMGAGIAASRTPNPNSARLHSLINHAVFGLGLFLSALAVRFFEFF